MPQVPHREAGAAVVHVFGAQSWQRGAGHCLRTIQLLHEQRWWLFHELGVVKRRFSRILARDEAALSQGHPPHGWYNQGSAVGVVQW